MTLTEVTHSIFEKMPTSRTRILADYVMRHHLNVCEENRLTLFKEALEAIFRRLRKHRPTFKETISIEQMCLSFKLPVLNIPTQISIPREPDNLVYGRFDWKDTQKATLREAELHIQAKRAQIRCDQQQLNDFIRLYRAALQRANGNVDLSFEELSSE